jgi:hypothetical protein
MPERWLPLLRAAERAGTIMEKAEAAKHDRARAYSSQSISAGFVMEAQGRGVCASPNVFM